MPRCQTHLLNNSIFSILALLHVASAVDATDVSRICGRIEIGGYSPHERPKLFQVAEVKGARSSILRPGDSSTHHAYRTQFYQHVKKQSKRIWRRCKHRHGLINMLWTRKNGHRKDKVPKKYTKTPDQFGSIRSLPYRYAKKIKRQDVTNFLGKQSSQITPKPMFQHEQLNINSTAFKSFDHLKNVINFPKNIKPNDEHVTRVMEDESTFTYLQYDNKKKNVPRLAPFTSKPMRTPPPFIGFRESFLMLTAEGDIYTTRKDIHHTTAKPLLNNLIHNSGENIGTKKNQRRIISFYWATENTTLSYRTTVQDKIIFFENYDQYTAAGLLKRVDLGKLYDIITDEKEKGADIGNFYDKGANLKVRLDDVNHDIPHVDDNYLYSKTAVKRENSNLNENYRVSNKQFAGGLNISNKQYNELKNLSHNLVNKRQYNDNVNENSNSPVVASWTKFPFVAVYIYEPSQVHCDAAALSPHWLVTAGACLYRPHRDIALGGQSAFVTYCGADWRIPERITYVKYSVVHPKYHPRDETKRHVYNIGLVRVVNSMQSSCAGWSPVSLRWDQFVADPKGSSATVVGWGLDSYAGLDSTTDLAKLMQYDGKIYSEICPANSEYNKLVQVTVKPNVDPNIYCLSLPRQKRNEEDDATHGSILLVEGKLVGLYLEDEQRQWAEPSAQYTSIWRLTTWIQETAREQEGTENITIVDI